MIKMNVPDFLQEKLEAHGGMENIEESLPDDEELKEESRVYRALSDPMRLKILHLLSVEPLCVCLIKKVTGMSDSKLSYHLAVLKESGLIIGDRTKNWIIYRITEKGEEMLTQSKNRKL